MSLHALVSLSSARNKLAAMMAALLLASLAVLLVRGRPIAATGPHAVVEPDLGRLPAVRACWVEYGRNETSGQVATAGITRLGTWDVTVAGLLVHHPGGDLVVDVGNSSHFDEEISGFPPAERFLLRAIPGSNRTVATAPAALQAAGVDLARLTVVVSHMHVDHAGGLVDLPGVPVLLPEQEIAFAAREVAEGHVHVVPAHARALGGRARPITFQPRPYETFDESMDVFGDGSVVVVPLPGHTPGSVGVFVNVSPSRRMFHVGDAVNVVEAVERRLTKSVVMATTDDAREAADAAVARIAELHEKRPAIAILPAHDRTAWKGVFGEAGRCVE
jgi:N-acyl homoserine lactone hydrolase